MLSNVEAEGASKLTPAERLLWVAHGKGMVRRTHRGKRKWEPALTARANARGKAQLEDFHARPKREAERKKRAWERRRASVRAKARSGAIGRAV
jgi:hypothetical protein